MATDPADPTADTGTEIETPAADPAAPEGAPPEGTRAEQPDTNWEQRYKDLQSEYTRTSQEAAELRRQHEETAAEAEVTEALDDPDMQDQAVAFLVEQLGEDGARQWLEEHGYEIDDDEDTTDEPARDPRVDDLLAERDQDRLNAQVAEIEKGMNTRLDELCTEKGIELTDEAKEMILDSAVLNETKEGSPDVDKAFNGLLGFRDHTLKGYRQSKRDQPTPPVPGSTSGERQSPLGDQKSRLALANEIAEQAAQSS